MKKSILGLILFATAAFGQNVPNHSVPIGRGPGVSGWASAGPCTVGQFLSWPGTSADPTCTTPNISDLNVYLLGTGGQSNEQGQSADPTLSPKVPPGKVLQYFAGNITDANDPVDSANPSSSSPALGNQLYLATGKRWMIVPSAVGGTAQCETSGTAQVGNWNGANGTLAPQLIANLNAAAAAARARGWNPIIMGIDWDQGENDAGALLAATQTSGGVTTVTGGPYTAGSTGPVSLTSMTGFQSNQFVIFQLDNGTTFTPGVTVSGGALTLATGVPNGRSINTGASAVVYSQGHYRACMQNMLAYLRSQLIDGAIYPNLPLYISLTGIPTTGDQAGFKLVRQAQDQVAQSDPTGATKVVFRNAPSFVLENMMQNLQAVVAGNITGTTLTVTGVTYGTVQVFSAITAGASAGTTIMSLGTGVGGVGTYTVNNSQTTGPTTFTIGPSLTLHYKQEGYNRKGRETASGIISAQAGEIPIKQTQPVTRVRLGATLTNADILTLTLTNPNVVGSPLTITTTATGTDWNTFGQQVITNININTPALAAAGIFAAYVPNAGGGGTVTFYYPPTGPPGVVTASWSGSTETWAVSDGAAAYGDTVTPAPRTRLAANTTYYVRTDGDDNICNGLISAAATNTPNCAFATLPQAKLVIDGLDNAGFNTTIQLVDLGSPVTFTSGFICSAPWVGSGTVTLSGNITTPANTIISTTGTAVLAEKGCYINVQGLKLASSAANGLQVRDRGHINITGKMDFGAIAGADQSASREGEIVLASGVTAYTISAGAHGAHWNIANNGSITYNQFGVTVTLTGTPTFTQFLQGATNGSANTATPVYSGAAGAGAQCTVSSGAQFINTNKTSIPGTASTCSVTSGGVN